jgi:glycerate dehydrogenase
MHRIVFLERNALDANVRRPAFAHEWQEHGAVAAADLPRLLRDATIAVVNKTPLKRELLEGLPALKMVAIAATGYDNVDLACCRQRGIVVSNIRGYALHTVPEHTFALILALRRNLAAYREEVLAGRWQAADRFCLLTHPIEDLHGSTIGILGEGVIGQGVARIAQGFGMRVLFADHAPPKAEGVDYTPLEDLLRQSDIVTLHLPLGPGTRNAIGARELGLMKRGALLINTARGGLVDEQALAAALREGRIAGAGFDVLSTEPPRAGNPLLDPALPNLLVTPHVAWASRQAMQGLADQLMDNVEAFAAGVPRNVLT